MKKVKLSTLSVNAAKLGSQLPDYYNFRKYGLGTQTNDVIPIVKDFNADLQTGFYTGSGTAGETLNTPSTDISYTLLHIKRASGYAYQIAFGIPSDARVYYRNSTNGYWAVWRRITIV